MGRGDAPEPKQVTWTSDANCELLAIDGGSPEGAVAAEDQSQRKRLALPKDPVLGAHAPNVGRLGEQPHRFVATAWQGPLDERGNLRCEGFRDRSGWVSLGRHLFGPLWAPALGDTRAEPMNDAFGRRPLCGVEENDGRLPWKRQDAEDGSPVAVRRHRELHVAQCVERPGARDSRGTTGHVPDHDRARPRDGERRTELV